MTGLALDLSALAAAVRVSYAPAKPVLVFPSAWMSNPEARAEIESMAHAHQIHLADSLTSPLIPLGDWISKNA